MGIRPRKITNGADETTNAIREPRLTATMLVSELAMTAMPSAGPYWPP